MVLSDVYEYLQRRRSLSVAWTRGSFANHHHYLLRVWIQRAHIWVSCSIDPRLQYAPDAVFQWLFQVWQICTAAKLHFTSVQ